MTEQMDWRGLAVHSSFEPMFEPAFQPSWLATLLDRFETVSQSETAAVACDSSTLAACQRYLARPCAYAPPRPVSRLN